jgi:hypothetical protein
MIKERSGEGSFDGTMGFRSNQAKMSQEKLDGGSGVTELRTSVGRLEAKDRGRFH